MLKSRPPAHRTAEVNANTCGVHAGEHGEFRTALAAARWPDAVDGSDLLSGACSVLQGGGRRRSSSRRRRERLPMAATQGRGAQSIPRQERRMVSGMLEWTRDAT
jgi:hypothetical protein